MKKLFISLIALLVFSLPSKADEGMWMLPYLSKLNIADMQSKGLELSADDIYRANGTAIKDAIVIFGNGCTGEIVSPEGLLLTNHHCGYGNIQSLSSVENDYLKNGFWAMSREQELPAPGLSVRFIRHIEDVTGDVLKGVGSSMEEAECARKIKSNIDKITAKREKKNKGMEVTVNEFFGGNQYFLFVIERYTDVRLVGAPPTSIGKFGADTDNWMWPRHTGDFSVFRVYSGADGRPADYSKDNIPYQAPVHLKVSLKGYQEGDYAMIMGFPGSTSRYMTSYEIDQVLDVDNPNRIYIRGVRQDVLKEFMNSNDEIRIKYAAKYASSSNYWKNSIGMSRGLRRLDVKGQKQEIERQFTEWTQTAEGAPYSGALDMIREAVAERIPYASLTQYLNETVGRPIEIATISRVATRIKPGMDQEQKEELLEAGDVFYKDYDPVVDRAMAKAMMRIIVDNIDRESLPQQFVETIDSEFQGNTDSYVDWIYDNSVFADHASYNEFIMNGVAATAEEDPAYILTRQFMLEAYNEARKNMTAANEKFRRGHRLFIAGLTRMNKDKVYYPDANFTIRLTHGNILPYSPADAVEYNYYTTLKGVMEKEDPNNPVDFTVPQKLKDLYYASDYGPYGGDELVTCFISNSDITGGNSGSPVMNSRGELIGLAFDGNWEAMSGDIAFEPELQRCINVDIRYVLFIIDKYAGAGYLLDEMTIVK